MSISVKFRSGQEEVLLPDIWTRYRGSKRELLPWLWANFPKDIKICADAFSGSGCVSYMLKTKNLQVMANDIMQYAYSWAYTFVESNSFLLTKDDLLQIMNPPATGLHFIYNNFPFFFTQQEAEWLENVRYLIKYWNNPPKELQTIAMITLLILRNSPYGLFSNTLSKDRYRSKYDDSGVKGSIIDPEFVEYALDKIQSAPFDNGHECSASNLDVFNFLEKIQADAVYFDPPYPSATSNYFTDYHFLEGYCSLWDWTRAELRGETRTLASPKEERVDLFSGSSGLRSLARTFKASQHIPIWLVSLNSSISIGKAAMLDVLRTWRSVEVIEQPFTYNIVAGGKKRSENKASQTTEYLFVCT